MCRGVWNPPFLSLFHPLYQTTIFTKKKKKKKYPPFCRSCFLKKQTWCKFMQLFWIQPYFFTSKSYGGIKLVWIWRISMWIKLFKGTLDKYNIYLFKSNSIEDFKLNQYRNFQLILPMRFHFMMYFVNSIIFRVSHRLLYCVFIEVDF